MWADVHALLDVPLIAPDLRGFGATPLGDGEPSVDVYADDVVAELDRRGIDQAVVGGVSLGGYIVMSMLLRYPSRIAALVLADTKAAVTLTVNGVLLGVLIPTLKAYLSDRTAVRPTPSCHTPAEVGRLGIRRRHPPPSSCDPVPSPMNQTPCGQPRNKRGALYFPRAKMNFYQLINGG